MGVESFFFTVELSNDIQIETIKELFCANGFCISSYYKKYGGLFKTKKRSMKEFVVNGIVLVSLDASMVNFQACFSCYEKAINIMFNCSTLLSEKQMVKCILYAGNEIKDALMSKESFFDHLYEINQNRLLFFKTNYTDQNIEILPNNYFFDYYRHHKREL